MTIVYHEGPYAGQDDFLKPPPHRLGALGGRGFYQRTDELDGRGRVVYQWVPATPAADTATEAA